MDELLDFCSKFLAFWKPTVPGIGVALSRWGQLAECNSAVQQIENLRYGAGAPARREGSMCCGGGRRRVLGVSGGA